MEDDEPLTPEAMLAMASTFDIIPYDPEQRRSGLRIRSMQVRLTRRNPEAWAISDGSFDLAKDGFWEYSPMPSSRSKRFLSRCRWSSAVKAITFAREHLRLYPDGNKPEADETPQATNAPA